VETGGQPWKRKLIERPLKLYSHVASVTIIMKMVIVITKKID